MTNSVWASFSNDTSFPSLYDDLSVDVAIIGGGIAGITSAQLLSQEGLRVAVLEKDRVGANSSGHSTGNLYSAVSEILLKVRKKFGDEVMKKVISSRQEAIDLVEKNIERFGIDCDFKRVPWNYYTTLKENEGKIEKALEAARVAKLSVEESVLPETPFQVLKGMSIKDAGAQFNPLSYVQGLAKAIENNNCLIFENSEVIEIHQGSEDILLRTKFGKTVSTRYLIHATHTPKGISVFHTELGPYREYGVACKIKGRHPEGIYFGYFVPSDITSTRLYERNGEEFLICVGESHKVGHEDNLQHLNRLEQFARQHFEVIEVTHTWGAQNYKPADYLPYIGPKIAKSRVYVATGFSTHGLTYGTVAAMVISDQITKGASPYSDIYKPSRFTPLKSAPKFIKENVDVFSQYVKDFLLKRNNEDFSEVKTGEGRVLDHEGHKLAVFKDWDQSLKVCSAICPHMGCVVHWNNAEESWDCPCHGSRFDTAGEVLEGPALKALAKFNELRDSTDDSAAVHQNDQGHVMTQDELVDEASMESFPASDPPGYSSKSQVDREQHRN